MAKKGLMEQDLSIIGHVAHGKSTIVKAISGVQVFPSSREKHDEFMMWELVKRCLNHKVMCGAAASVIDGSYDMCISFNVGIMNVRPSADGLPKDIGLIVTSCWKEDPNGQPNFSQIIQMLQHYLSANFPPEPRPMAIRACIFTSQNAVFSSDSPGTSTLIAKTDESVEGTPKTPTENRPRGPDTMD
ncbi:serine/threonine-protein kinase HT1-like protein [Tanacetum coccineum]